MEIQKSFSKTAFGGFKKEDVTQYIDEIMTKYDEEVSLLKSEGENATAQITELKSIIEEQYKKIVEITLASEGISADNQENIKKIADLEAQLNPFIAAKSEAASIVEAAKKEANESSAQIKQQLWDANQQAQSILSKATEEATALLEPAKRGAEAILHAAREKEREIISLAKSQENELLEEVNRQIEATILLSEENNNKAFKLLADAKTEAQMILHHARAEAESEKVHYDGCIKALETQKSRLLLSLDEIKGGVQAIQITRLPKSEIESFQALRQSTTEAIRKKFAMLNKERQGDNSRD